MRSASAVACSVVALLGACSSTPKPVEPDPAIVGSWKAATDGSMLTLSGSGLYSLVISGQAKPVIGSFEFDPKQRTIQMSTRRESPACGDDTATYMVRVGELRMDLEPVKDACELRRKIFSQPLDRVRNAR